MPQFFVKKTQINSSEILVDNPDDLKHLVSVLRIKKGDILNFIDEEEFVYETEVSEVSKRLVKAQVLRKEKSKRKLSLNLTLAQSVLKNNAQDIAIQKAVELGTPRIIPVLTKRTVPKFLSEKEISSKIEKWNKIAFETCKQCERSSMPVIERIVPLEELNLDEYDIKIACLERSTTLPLKKLLRSIEHTKESKILVVIGPEGGFCDEELDFFEKNNFCGVTLGNLILRAETAVISALSCVIYEYED